MTETIQHFIDSGDRYELWCHNSACGHHAHIDMLKLRDRLGPDHGCLHDDIIHLFRCSKCGGKKIGLQRQAKGNDEKWPRQNLYAKAKGL
jgi:hypothetical protein